MSAVLPGRAAEVHNNRPFSSVSAEHRPGRGVCVCRCSWARFAEPVRRRVRIRVPSTSTTTASWAASRRRTRPSRGRAGGEQGRSFQHPAPHRGGRHPLTCADVGQARVVAQHRQHHQRLLGGAGLAPAGPHPASVDADQLGDQMQGLARQWKGDLVGKGLEALGGLLTHISILPRASPMSRPPRRSRRHPLATEPINSALSVPTSHNHDEKRPLGRLGQPDSSG